MGKSEKNSPFIKDSTKSKDKIITQNQDNYMIYDSEDLTLIKSISNLPNINAPFGSSSIKSTLLPQAISEAPGPGSYDIEFEINNMNNNIPISDYSNKFFITGDTRFKSSDNHVPGVGEYDLANSNSVNNNKNNLTPKKISRNTKIISHDFKSPRRIPSIPDKDTKFGFGEDREGKMAILTDPYLDQKFDGTQSNSIGPDRYNTLIKKHNNALDWKKAGKKTLEMKIEKNKTEEYYNYDNYKYINNLTSNSAKNDFDKLSDFYNYTNKTEGNITNNKSKNNKKLILNNNNNTLTNRTTRFKIYHNKKIYKNENLGFKDNHDMSYIDLTSVPIKKKEKLITPGPGAYDPNIGNFKFEPKKNKFQNFGTYESRNMAPIPRIKNYQNLLNNSLNNIYKFNNVNKSIDEKNKLNRFSHSLHNFKINIIKDQSMKLKEEVKKNLGPGTYSPEFFLNFGYNIINNNKNNNKKNNTNHKIISEINKDRNPIYISVNDYPGVGEYDIAGEIKKEIDYILFLKKSKEQKDKNDLKLKMEHARKKIRKKKENKIIIRREYKDTEEYKIRQQFLKNYYRPAFDSAEPKFKDFGSKDDSNIGVGSYNLIYPRKKIGQIKVPFLNGAKKWSDKNFENYSKTNKNVGPGTYEQRSFFDWNKKSFNVQYKLK
jgi:hypothetical protein